MVEYKSLGFLGFPKHRVGNDSSVWSIIKGFWKRLKPRGHPAHGQVVLINEATKKGYNPLYLALVAFGHPKPIGAFAYFIDGNKDNTWISNLRWETPLFVVRQRYPEGTVKQRREWLNEKRASAVSEERKSGKLAQEKLILEEILLS